MKSFILLMFILIFVSGCAEVPTTTVESFFDAAGNITKEVVTGAIDRDKTYMERGETRDKYTKDMYATQGVKVTFEKYEFSTSSGEKIFFVGPKEITAKAPHSYQQNIETRPPDHRGWNSFDNVVDRGFQGVLAWLTAGVLSDSIDRSSPVYRGDYVNQSYNPVTTTETQIPFAQ